MTDHRPAVIFDLDGTVWDSAPGILTCIELTLPEFGVACPPRQDLLRWLGPPLNEMLVELGVPADRVDDARVLYRRHYREVGELDCTVFDGVPELLDRLRDAGHPMATATSKGVEPTERMLEHFGLRHRFDAVGAASMTATGHDKRQIVAGSIAAIGATGGVMVGDRVYDIDGGRANGLTTVGVHWGYAPPGELEEAGADHVVGTVAELADLLLAGFQPLAAQG